MFNLWTGASESESKVIVEVSKIPNVILAFKDSYIKSFHPY